MGPHDYNTLSGEVKDLSGFSRILCWSPIHPTLASAPLLDLQEDLKSSLFRKHLLDTFPCWATDLTVASDVALSPDSGGGSAGRRKPTHLLASLTLPPALGCAGHRAPVFPGPVEIVRRLPADLTVQGDLTPL